MVEQDVAVGLDEVVTACEHMLRCRGLTCGPLPPEWGTDPRMTAIGSGFRWVPEDGGLLLVVTESVRVTTHHLKGLLEAMDVHGIGHVQLVSRVAVTIQTQNVVPMGNRLSILPWHIPLLYPLDHTLVPAHRRATAEDLALLSHVMRPRKRSGSTGTVLPSLRADDPIAQYLGLQVGDVVRIDRHDGTVYFRSVVTAR